MAASCRRPSARGPRSSWSVRRRWRSSCARPARSGWSRLRRGFARDRRHRRRVPGRRRLGAAADRAARPGAPARRARVSRRFRAAFRAGPRIELLLPGARHSPERDAAADPLPLRRRQRLLRALPRPVDDLQLRAVLARRETLEEAQRAKLDLIARSSSSTPGQRVLDVGCGWGSFAIHAAREYGVSVTGITLSHSQAELARERGRRGRRRRPRRDPRCRLPRARGEPFDAIASIGMAEHVGAVARSTTTRSRCPGCCSPAGCCSTTPSA